MRPRMVVVVEVGRQHAMKMPLAEDQELVQAFLADRANPALRKGIRIRRPHWPPNDRHILRRKDRIEGSRKLGVTVVDQETHRQASVLDVPTQLARLLGHPSTGRVRGAAGQMDTATAELDEKQHIEGLQPSGLDGEEVTGQDLVSVLSG